VRFRGIAEVLPGPGIAAFGAVVVLTLLSSLSLDPRLIWDTRDADRA
jgi:paraquat-inducible protein A